MLPPMDDNGGGPGEAAPASSSRWATATARAAVLLAASVVGFVVFPNWLVGYLSTRVTPTGRDILLAIWLPVGVVLVGFLFARVTARDR
jgi:hypothetical protein